MKKIAMLFLIVGLAIALGACRNEAPTDGIRVPASSSNFEREDYQDVLAQLQAAGFENIRTEGLGDLITGWITRDGSVNHVSIDGETSFRRNNLFPADAEVIIVHHSFPERTQDGDVDTNNESAQGITPNSEPVQAASEDETKTPANLNHLIGNHYQEVIDALFDMGFSNIRTIPMEDLTTGWLRSEGEVSAISVGNNNDDDMNAEVIITHHSFPIARSRLTLHEISLDIPSDWRNSPSETMYRFFPTDSDSDGFFFFTGIALSGEMPNDPILQRAFFEQFVNEDTTKLAEFDLEIAGRRAARFLSNLNNSVILEYAILTDYYMYIVGIDLSESSPPHMQHILEGVIESIAFSIWAPSPFADVEVGDVIQFGDFDWRVLDVQDGQALIISEYILERRYFHRNRTDGLWATSSIRNYLNHTFLNSFNETDRAQIKEVLIRTESNPWYEGAESVVETTDRIFLLSVDEVLRYFGDSGTLGRSENERTSFSDQYDSARIAHRTNGVERWDDGMAIHWWLRTPGGSWLGPGGSMVTLVRHNGVIDLFGHHGWDVDERGYHGVRPALWLDIR